MVWPLRLWRRALNLLFDFPFSVRGPEEFVALPRLISARVRSDSWERPRRRSGFAPAVEVSPGAWFNVSDVFDMDVCSIFDMGQKPSCGLVRGLNG